VKGNHDGRSDVDRELLDRLAKVPNVVLLQPDPQTYAVQSIGGVRVAGFDDPRWFGDDNRNNAAKQRPATDAFNAAMADTTVPDMVVSHEPAAVEGVERAGVKVNGHLHKAELEGNRIGVGTFTGGGPFSHFLTAEEGQELTGQPSAFDIAAFGEDCRIASLTRYQFRNVIEGRPAYDDVTLINGSRIEETVPAPPSGDTTRTCGRGVEPTTERIPATPR